MATKDPIVVNMTDSSQEDPEKAGYTFEVELQDVYEEGESGIDPIYHAKARVLNSAFQEIGMGKYQVSIVSCFHEHMRFQEAWSLRANAPRCNANRRCFHPDCIFRSGSCSSSPDLDGSRTWLLFYVRAYINLTCYC